MAGSIRTFVGLFLCWGAAGGLDNSDNLLASLAVALGGIVLMASGVAALGGRRI